MRCDARRLTIPKISYANNRLSKVENGGWNSTGMNFSRTPPAYPELLAIIITAGSAGTSEPRVSHKLVDGLWELQDNIKESGIQFGAVEPKPCHLAGYAAQNTLHRRDLVVTQMNSALS